MSEAALVVVDVQRDFLDPDSADVGSWEKAFCVPGVERLLTHARAAGLPVVHVGTMHEGVDTLPAHQRRRGMDAYCVRGEAGCEFVVPPQDGEAAIYKGWYSAFESGLRDCIGEVATIIWTGVATDCCIQQSAFDADRLGIRSIVPVQGVSASVSDAFVASLVALEKSAADVVDLDELVLGGGVAAAAMGPKDIKELARRWFTEQQLKIQGATGLDGVLAALRGA